MVRLFLLTALTMVALSANSLLNRAALTDGTSGPAAFAAIRLLSGAVCLSLLCAVRGGLPCLLTQKRWIGAGSLAIYMLGFSFAFVVLDAGIGTLILFGVVQVMMFSGALLGGERPPATRWLGAIVALTGLVWLVWPTGSDAPKVTAAALMFAAAVGWGVYSLAGRQAIDPLPETAANFVCATPLALLIWVILPDGLSATGTLLACLSGAVTSGMGYALWYTILPKLDATTAGLAQLTVPVIALAGSVVLLSEPITQRLVLSSLVILGGVALGVLGQRRISSSGS